MKLLHLLSIISVAVAIVAAQTAEPLHLKMGNRRTRTLTRFGANNGPTIPMQGNLTYWAEYFVQVGLGTPAQSFNLQVDTGSTDMIVYSVGCSGCNKQTVARFDCSKSSTCDPVNCMDDDYYCTNQCQDISPCEFEDDYGDGSSIKGQVAQDKITLGSVRSKSLVDVGQIKYVSSGMGFEPTNVDGILGFAFQPLSGWEGDSAWSFLVGDFGWYDGYSMCMGTNGGTLSLGVDHSADPSFKWTAITDDQWYTVYLNDIKFNNQSLGIAAWRLNWNGVIVDSGTTLLIVYTQVYQAMQQMLTAMCKTTNLVGICNLPAGKTLFDGQCFNMTASQVNVFPSLTYTFDGAGDVTIGPNQYLWQGTGVPFQYCLGIAKQDDIPMIVGDVLMQNFHVAFDNNRGKVGFGPVASCPSSKQLTPLKL